MSASKPLAGWLACALLVAGVACRLAGISQEELPQAAIAIHYRTPEEARLHAEDREAARQVEAERRGVSRGPNAPPGVAHTDDLGAYLGGVLGAAPGANPPHRGRLALLDPRTGGVTVVAAALRGSIPLAWSADRRRLLFAQPDGADSQLWELLREPDTVRALTRGPLAHTQGCYGPDGRIVAVEVDTRARPQRSWVAVSAQGGRGPFAPLSPGPRDHSPTCAPDGSAVAYVRETQRQRGQIWLAPLAGAASPRMLAAGRHPRFSPDGEWVVFSAPVQDSWRLWRMRPDGSARAPLGRGVREESNPAISPDGRFVAYVAAEAEFRQHLYLRRFEGSGDRILFADGDGDLPVW